MGPPRGSYVKHRLLVMVERLFLAVLWGCLWFVIVVFPDHTRYFSCADPEWVLWGCLWFVIVVFPDHTRYFSCADPEWDRGPPPPPPPPPLKNHRNIVFLSNTGSDPLKVAKLPNQYSMLGHYLMAFRWQADDDPLKVVFGSSLPSSTTKEEQKKNVNVRTPSQPLTKISGSTHGLI